MGKKVKLYVKSGRHCEAIIISDSKAAAAKECAVAWNKLGKTMNRTVRVSEVGFGYEHPHHEHDEDFVVTRLLEK